MCTLLFLLVFNCSITRNLININQDMWRSITSHDRHVRMLSYDVYFHHMIHYTHIHVHMLICMYPSNQLQYNGIVLISVNTITHWFGKVKLISACLFQSICYFKTAVSNIIFLRYTLLWLCMYRLWSRPTQWNVKKTIQWMWWY